MEKRHWAAVEDIYRAGIATGHATFEADPPRWSAFGSTRLPGQRWVALDGDGTLRGWVAAALVSERQAYAGVVEHSVYVDPASRGTGVGRLLLEALVDSTERAGIWTIQSGIFPENAASLALHEALGFRLVGTRRGAGLMTYGPRAGEWRDVLLIERRSAVAGR
ncbi:MAG: N-acetyltransferase family protein [Lapillicoccus sp.]